MIQVVLRSVASHSLLECFVMRANARQILTFLVLVFAFSSIPYALMIHTGHIGAGNGMVVRLVMWCPAFAAVVSCRLFRIDLASLGWNWRPAKYEVLAYVLPLIYALPVYVACWIAVQGSFNFTAYAQCISASYGLSQCHV